MRDHNARVCATRNDDPPAEDWTTACEICELEECEHTDEEGNYLAGTESALAEARAERIRLEAERADTLAAELEYERKLREEWEGQE